MRTESPSDMLPPRRSSSPNTSPLEAYSLTRYTARSSSKAEYCATHDEGERVVGSVSGEGWAVQKGWGVKRQAGSAMVRWRWRSTAKCMSALQSHSPLTSCSTLGCSRQLWMRISRLTWYWLSCESLLRWYTLMATWMPLCLQMARCTVEA